MKISVVIPIYKCRDTILELVQRIQVAVSSCNCTHEIILVDDACPDNSWDSIQQVKHNYPGIIGIRFSRNFGQHHAITAGLDHCSGDWIVVMDGDLQDPPEEIPNLYRKALEGYSIVLARRINRQDNFLKKFQNKVFYKLFSFLSGIQQDSSVGNFGIYHKNCIEVYTRMREPMRAFPPMIQWIGFNKTAIETQHASRAIGKSSYSLKKLLRLASDISLSYSDKPLRICIGMGVLMSFSAIIFSLFLVYSYFTGSIKVEGYTSLMVSLWFLSGVLLFFLGITGLYISRIFETVKGRPLYIIEHKI